MGRRRLLTRRHLLIAAPFVLGARRVRAWPRGSVGAASDPIAAVLATMVSGQWKLLTVSGASYGGIGTPLPALTQANWDYGVGNSGAATTWACDSGGGCGIAVNVGGTSPAPHGVLDFSASCVRSDGEINHFGGGHGSGGDNSVVRFSAKAACQNLLGQGGSQAWSLLVPGGFYLPQSAPKPAWSFEGYDRASTVLTTGTYTAGSSSVVVASIAPAGGGSAANGWFFGGVDFSPFTEIASITGTGPYTITLTNPINPSQNVALNNGTGVAVGMSASGYYWATTNVNGDKRTIASHSYWSCCALGLTGWWATMGRVAWGPNPNIVGSTAQELVNDNGHTSLTGQIGSSNTNSGYAIGGQPLWCDLDSKVYCWGDNSAGAHLFRISNPTTTTPTLADLGAFSPGGVNETNTPVVLCQYPDSSHRAIYALQTASTFSLATDITGTPGSSTFTFGSTPTLATPQTYNGLCFDTLRSRIVSFYGNGQLGYITLGSNAATATYTQESSGAVSGDLPSTASFDTDKFARIEYLPTQDAYVCAMGGQVWLRKP